MRLALFASFQPCKISISFSLIFRKTLIVRMLVVGTAFVPVKAAAISISRVEGIITLHNFVPRCFLTFNIFISNFKVIQDNARLVNAGDCNGKGFSIHTPHITISLPSTKKAATAFFVCSNRKAGGIDRLESIENYQITARPNTLQMDTRSFASQKFNKHMLSRSLAEVFNSKVL